MQITIRRFQTLEEYASAEQLQMDAWGSGPIDAVPRNLLIRFQSEGGLVLGAFLQQEHGERLIGFVVGFLGRDAAGLKHCSHMAAVHPDFRDQNIAYRMKLMQREFALSEGLERVTWTYDPLEARNAMLNIAKLGATCSTYIRNIYGISESGINAHLPTDRFYVHWEVGSQRVSQAVESGSRVLAPVAETLLTQVEVQGDLPRLRAMLPLAPQPLLGVQIPANFQAVKRASNELALQWRLETRAAFESAFAAGYRVVNMTRDSAFPQQLARYTLLYEPPEA